MTAIPKQNIKSEITFFENVNPSLKVVLRFLIDNKCPVKWSYALDVTFTKQDVDGISISKNASFLCKRYAFNNFTPDDVKTNIKEMRASVQSSIDKFCNEGSHWLLDSIDKIDIHLYRVVLENGGAPVDLPASLKAKKCVLNINTEYCFKYAVLSSLHKDEVHHANLASEYQLWEQEFVFPETAVVNAADIAIFSKTSNLAIYTHVWNEKLQAAECTYRPPTQACKTFRRIHLLSYKQHWMAITNLSALYTTSRHAIKMCDLCLAKFHNYNRFLLHLPCSPSNYIQIKKMPIIPTLKFNEFNKLVALTDVIYADLEAILENVNDNNNILLQKHIPCCVGAYHVSSICQSTSYKEFFGNDCMLKFVRYLDEMCHSLYQRNKLETRKPADKTAEQIALHNKATTCVWCKDLFDSDRKKKMFDHDHVTGAYVGAACSLCNFKRKQDRNTLVVVFHNFRGYDSHALCLEGLSKMPNWDLRPIAQNPEKYIALMAYLNVEPDGSQRKRAATFRIRFIDSLQLMPSSLATLVNNLVGEKKDYSKLTHSNLLLFAYPNLQQEDIAAKGIFPYSYVSSWEKLQEKRLPPFEDFYDVLEEAVSITNDEYRRAKQMFEAFECKTLADYQMRYLELDCRLLADVFEEFRRVIMKEDQFDPLHFLTISMLSYSSALKWADSSIGLIKEEEMYRDVERCKRGGYSFVNKHWCMASNPYVGVQDGDVYLGNVDANNLYGNALRYPLPIGDFKYMNEAEYNSIDWMHVNTDGDFGYFVVCDLHYPSAIHNITQNLPLAPELADVTYDKFTPYMKALFMRRNLSRNPDCKNPEKYNSVTKLLATCRDKKEYVVHFLVLKLYLQLGMKISKIHRVISFRQAPIFRQYIDFNTARRAAATNDFEKDLYKQKNCSLFGKSMENKRNRCDIVLCNSHNKMIKAASKHCFKHARIFNTNLAAACMTKCNVELDAPIAIGASVLDISKYIMYKLAYVQLPQYKQKFGCKINIVGGDTDSFFIEVKGVDMMSVLYPQMAMDGLLDTSNYPQFHPLFSNAHKAQLDCIKDEFAGSAYSEFILLRPKAYSMLPYGTATTASKRKCKGVARRKVKQFSHADFKQTFLCQREVSVHCRRMQSQLHVVYNVDQYKIALSFADDKRCWHSSNFSLPYGHIGNDYFAVFPPAEEIDEQTRMQTDEEIIDELFPPMDNCDINIQIQGESHNHF